VKMKKKIMAIWVILLLVAIPYNIVQASENQENEQNNETLFIELIDVDDDGILTTETLSISEEGLAELENTISIWMDNILSTNSWEKLENIIDNLPKTNGIITSIILKILSKFKQLSSRGLIISLGHSYKLNPFRKNLFRLRQKFTFWLYSNGGKTEDRTIILKPFALRLRIIRGLQFGFMKNFFGIYIYIAKKFPQKSTTFFMGTARRINGIQLLPS